MDKPLVANAVYISDHGAVNPVAFIANLEDEGGSYEGIESPSEKSPSKPRTLETVLAQRKVADPTSNCSTMMNILKGNIGTGILAMPQAFKHSGLMVGTIGILVIGVICVHCMHMLVSCARTLYVRMNVTKLDYCDVAEHSFRTGPKKVQRFSRITRNMTIFFICLTQFGFCCVYYLFLAQNCKEVIDHLANVTWEYQYYMAMFLPLIIGLNFIRNLRFISYISTVANILQLGSFILIFYVLIQDLPATKTRNAFSGFSELPLWFGTAVYAFEGISLVLPLENKMRTPLDFGGCTGVLNTGLVIVASLYAAVGFFGYLKYGSEIEGSVTLNIALESVIGIVVRLAYAIAILFSYVLQMYVPIEVLFPELKKLIPTRFSHYETYFENAFRITIVMLTFVLAASISQLGPMISLVGAVSGSYLAIIFPPILEMVTYWDEDISKITIAKDIAISAFGILGFVTGTYTSIHEIIYPS